MTGYTKLFGSIIASTIWREPHTVRIVWITMLAAAGKNGIVEASIPGLADLSRVTVEECESAIAALQAPDKYSRTKEHEGRRIEEVDGGWLVLNHGKYRAKMNSDERREYLRVKQQEARDKKKGASTKRQQSSTGVNNCKQSKQSSTQAEAEAEAEADTKAEASNGAGGHSAPERKEAAGDHHEFIRLWSEAFQVHFKIPYRFGGGKDGGAVKNLLATKRPLSELIAIARKAWKQTDPKTAFNCAKATTIAAFNSAFNEIQIELKRAAQGSLFS